MRILILSFYFEPDLSAGSFRMAGLVEALQRKIDSDVRIDFLTTQPNRYASYSQAALPEEVRGAVTVKRFGLPAHRSGFLDQSRAFAAYAYQVIRATRGGQRSQLEDAVNDLSNVKIMSPVSRKDLLALYRGSDILFLHLNDYPAFRKVLPSKLFEYAVTGKPIVAGVAGYAALFLQRVPGAVAFQPCNVEEGVAAIKNVKPGLESRQNFVERYRRVNLMKELAGNFLTYAKGNEVQQE